MFEIYANLILPRGGTMNKIAHLLFAFSLVGNMLRRFPLNIEH